MKRIVRVKTPKKFDFLKRLFLKKPNMTTKPKVMKLTKSKTTTLIGQTKPIVSFVDDSKKIIQCINSTPCFISDVKYNCFWCTLSVDNKPIGCPIKSVPIYTNKLTRQKIDGNEFSSRIEQLAPEKKFVTRGIFCSFNCVKAFIEYNTHDFTFYNSTRLLAEMYSLLTDNYEPVVIKPAPHMSMMIMYGGTLTPQQYRASFNRTLYIDKGTFTMIPLSIMYEEIDQYG